jgi:hypothetical protein
MAYTVIPDSEFAEGQPVKGVTGIALRDNVEGLANGDTGAPKIQAAAIDAIPSGVVDTAQIVAAAVGRSQLATSTASASGAVGGTSTLDITLNAYAFFPMIHMTNTGVLIEGHSVDGASADAPRFSFRNTTGSAETYHVDHRYIITA